MIRVFQHIVICLNLKNPLPPNSNSHIDFQMEDKEVFKSKKQERARQWESYEFVEIVSIFREFLLHGRICRHRPGLLTRAQNRRPHDCKNEAAKPMSDAVGELGLYIH